VKWKEFLFTSFYAGYSPLAPGTAGALFGVVVFSLLAFIFGSEAVVWINLVMVILLLYPFIWLSDQGEKCLGRKDPQAVVIDEVMGFWISVIFFPFDWKVVIAGFILFRLFDIFKPFPINSLQRYSGGLGIMLDDIAAGIMANIVLTLSLFASVLLWGSPWAQHIFLFR